MPGGLDCSLPEIKEDKEDKDLANQQVAIYDLGNSYPDLSTAKVDQLEPVVLATTSLTIAGIVLQIMYYTVEISGEYQANDTRWRKESGWPVL